MKENSNERAQLSDERIALAVKIWEAAMHFDTGPGGLDGDLYVKQRGKIIRAILAADRAIAPVSVAQPVANKPIGYVTSFALTHVLVHGGHIPMHPEPVCFATVPVYLAAQPAADNAQKSAMPEGYAQAPSVLTDALAHLDAVKRAGSQMANIFFNLAQRPGESIDIEMCMVLDKCRKEWDAATLAAPSAHATNKEGM